MKFVNIGNVSFQPFEVRYMQGVKDDTYIYLHGKDGMFLAVHMPIEEVTKIINEVAK